MINQYPLWKYLLIVVVVAVGGLGGALLRPAVLARVGVE